MQSPASHEAEERAARTLQAATRRCKAESRRLVRNIKHILLDVLDRAFLMAVNRSINRFAKERAKAGWLKQSSKTSACSILTYTSVYNEGNVPSGVVDEKLWKGEGIRLFGWSAVQEVFTAINRPIIHRSSSIFSPSGEELYGFARSERRRARNSRRPSQVEASVAEQEILEEPPAVSYGPVSVYRIKGVRKGTTTNEQEINAYIQGKTQQYIKSSELYIKAFDFVKRRVLKNMKRKYDNIKTSISNFEQEFEREKIYDLHKPYLSGYKVHPGMGDHDFYQRQQAWFEALEFSMSGTKLPHHSDIIRRILDLGFKVSMMQGVGRRKVAMAKLELQHANRHHDLWKELFDIITERKRQLAATKIQSLRRGYTTRRLIHRLRAGSNRQNAVKLYPRANTSKKFSKSFVVGKGQSLPDVQSNRRRKSSHSALATGGTIMGQEAKGLRRRFIQEYAPLYSLQMSQPRVNQDPDEDETLPLETTPPSEPQKWAASSVTLIKEGPDDDIGNVHSKRRPKIGLARPRSSKNSLRVS
uniref:Uncharacterized protein n=1 Tax=Hanusia phi TaxID=3032 RepID=A0A7S0DWS1_9CRYP|mmetsp:Transcript_11954/g.27611  ORF Transcript_11954/g.27611 Transcript_11954/m.27611 type:complete len:529 (+) Transcript_11954:15-1601(+)